MKILIVCMQYEYNNISRGFSYEYYNFYCSLKNLGHEVFLFDYMAEVEIHGKDKMNNKLFDFVKKLKPDLSLFSLYTDQFYPKTIKALSQYTRTLSFFHDDTWREEFSVFWSGHFNFFTTSDADGKRKYEAKKIFNSVYFPFGCNENFYKKIETIKKYDVSFVGAWHPYRDWIIGRVRKLGFSVKVAGYGWPEGTIKIEQMVSLFNESRINLNLSNSASWDARYLLSSPRALINLIRSPKCSEQIKARHFEINGCGAFQLSYYVNGLERNYEIGKEIAVYLNPDDLLKKITDYLADESLRRSISEAGYKKTLAEHTFKKRFDIIFERIGLLNR